MRVLDAAQTREALPMTEAIAAMEIAFTADSETPMRSALGGLLIMPGRLGEIVAVKVVSTVPGNPAGVVAVFGPDGSPLGLVDGPTLTAIRTGAVAGLASRLLARADASVMAMLGAGAMAADQVAAVRAVRPIERVLIWSRNSGNAERLAALVGGEVVTHPDVAVAAADIVSCATPARAPLFAASAVTPGTHINAVGAFTPEMVEVPSPLVREAFVVVEEREAAAVEAGDLIQAGREPDAVLRDLLSGAVPPPSGRTTFFKSVGVAAQDVAAGHRALARAENLDVGTLL